MSGGEGGCDTSSDTPSEPHTYKICGIIEPKGFFKERNDYALYIFSQTNVYVLHNNCVNEIVIHLLSSLVKNSPSEAIRIIFVPFSRHLFVCLPRATLVRLIVTTRLK